MSNPDRERWTFTIEPLPCDVPSVHRVRSALKLLLRRFGLRCTAILDAPPDPPTTPTPLSAASGGAEAVSTTTQEESK